MFALGLNHTTTTVAFRERLTVPQERQVDVLQRLAQRASLSELVILSTCNRVELYGVGTPEHAAAVLGALAQEHNIASDALRKNCFLRTEGDAARHIFRVAASLESMVLGEPQILGQVKEAYRNAQRAGTLGAVLDRCLTMAFHGAKRVRSQTALGHGGASVPSVAVDLAGQIFGSLSGLRALVVGAGEMAHQSAVYLRAEGVASLRVVNRSLPRAEEFAAEFGGSAAPWSALGDELARADIVICSTGATAPVIDSAMVRRAMRARRGAPLLLVDIAVPRDVEEQVAALDQVYLYNVDDLQQVVNDNLSLRSEQVELAAALVESELDAFFRWQNRRDLGPVLARLEGRARQLAQSEVARALGRLEGGGQPATPEQRAVLERLANSLIGKLLHDPIVHARDAAEQGNHVLADALGVLFAIDQESAQQDAERQALTTSSTSDSLGRLFRVSASDGPDAAESAARSRAQQHHSSAISDERDGPEAPRPHADQGKSEAS